ncbi:hypothetical protein CL632_02500 [bacterium]|jgi:UPF0755 protein|nr:hypothetical protein [bacterium]MDP6571226.1 endolytic transglycosylase MltG [Patescibacteria group bacterium]MDP6756213.1 endolytic transglycosylase MltG [Patescibacteria group bacterium]|tara:strand:+ start:13524 stop:14564 length:1041 start_codon:yes stop_codon:yes gene_type:complete
MSKTVYISIAIILIAIIAVTNVSRQIFGEVDVPEQSREFVIEQGKSVKQITNTLIEEDLIKSDFWFRVQVWLKGKQGGFLAGRFELPENISQSELIKLLTTEAKQETREIKILEGWGIRDIAIYFENLGMFQQEEFTELVGLPGFFGSADNDFFTELTGQSRLLVSRTAAAPYEGYLFPDTYEIFTDSSLKDIIRKMVINFDSKVTQDLRDEAARQEKNFYKVLIMASIIEAEVPNEEDRAIVSDIFWSRLESGVALQSDATLNYIIGGDSPALTLEQLEIDSAYNSYKYRELPPTPIGNPGISAIRAALYPADTDYFYFLSTPEGETIFSRTLQEHNIAKNKYLR